MIDQQLMGICNLQQSSQQAEDALSQGLEALQQSLVETLSSNSLGPAGSGNVAEYMGHMAIAMGKLATLENFLHQVMCQILYQPVPLIFFLFHTNIFLMNKKSTAMFYKARYRRH